MKALLVVWIGLGNTQVLDITPFETMAECTAAQDELQDYSTRLDGDCVPMTTEDLEP
jgi:hypothetical protein